MKIWKITSSEKNIVLTISEWIDFLDNIRGQSLIKEWIPFEVFIEGSKKKYKDFPSFLPGAPVINIEAKKKIESFLEGKVEFLSLIHENYSFFLLNITNVIDCVDQNKSIAEFSKKGKKTNYKKIYFNKELINTNDKIFKIPEFPSKYCFVSDEFKEFIENSSLHGPDFDLVWDSELDEETELYQQQIYDEYIYSINNSVDLSISWEEAMNHINQNKAVVSDRWKLKLDQDRNILLGQLNMDLQYDFVSPKYIPPILLDLKWKKA